MTQSNETHIETQISSMLEKVLEEENALSTSLSDKATDTGSTRGGFVRPERKAQTTKEKSFEGIIRSNLVYSQYLAAQIDESNQGNNFMPNDRVLVSPLVKPKGIPHFQQNNTESLIVGSNRNEGLPINSNNLQQTAYNRIQFYENNNNIKNDANFYFANNNKNNGNVYSQGFFQHQTNDYNFNNVRPESKRNSKRFNTASNCSPSSDFYSQYLHSQQIMMGKSYNNNFSSDFTIPTQQMCNLSLGSSLTNGNDFFPNQIRARKFVNNEINSKIEDFKFRFRYK